MHFWADAPFKGFSFHAGLGSEPCVRAALTKSLNVKEGIWSPEMHQWMKRKWREKMWYLNPSQSGDMVESIMRRWLMFLSFEALAVPRSGYIREFMGHSLTWHACHLRRPSKHWEQKVSERVKLKWHPNVKASAGCRRSFLTGNSCHLFVSADWSSVLLRSLLPYVVSMQRQTEMSAAEPARHEKKAAKKEGFALWDLWVQSEGKVPQGKAKHVPWMHGCVNCCYGLWSHGKTGCREQERPNPNQGGK